VDIDLSLRVLIIMILDSKLYRIADVLLIFIRDYSYIKSSEVVPCQEKSSAAQVCMTVEVIYFLNEECRGKI
jgi:hypothetical protein